MYIVPTRVSKSSTAVNAPRIKADFTAMSSVLPTSLTRRLYSGNVLLQERIVVIVNDVPLYYYTKANLV